MQAVSPQPLPSRFPTPLLSLDTSRVHGPAALVPPPDQPRWWVRQRCGHGLARRPLLRTGAERIVRCYTSLRVRPGHDPMLRSLGRRPSEGLDGAPPKRAAPLFTDSRSMRRRCGRRGPTIGGALLLAGRRVVRAGILVAPQHEAAGIARPVAVPRRDLHLVRRPPSARPHFLLLPHCRTERRSIGSPRLARWINRSRTQPPLCAMRERFAGSTRSLSLSCTE